MKINILIILLCFAITGESLSQDDKSYFLRNIPLLTRFESSDIKGGIQSWSFDQDSSGLLYVANNDGLLEFDGNKWKKYIVPSCTKLRAVKVDSENRIFVGGQGQLGYFISTEDGLDFTSLLSKLPADFQNIAEVWKILEYDNKIYFNTESQLIVFDGTDIKVLGLPGYMRFAFVVNDKMFVQFYEIGIFELVDTTFIPIIETNIISDMVSILPHASGIYLFSKSGEIYNYSNKLLKEVLTPFQLRNINDAILLENGQFIIGTQNDGLFILNSDLSFKQHLTKKEGLSDRTVKSLYEDDFNNLWVALNNGIDYLQLSLPLSLITDEVGLEGTGYSAYKHNNKFYLGTSNGLFKQTSNGLKYRRSKYEIVESSEGQVYNFSSIKGDLILNHNNGAFTIEDDGLKQFHDIGSWKFLETRNPKIVVGGDYQGISLFTKEKGNWLMLNRIPDLLESSRVMEFENDSTLWMTHGSKGAFRISFSGRDLSQTNIQYYGAQSGFPSNILISVYSLNGKLIFTSENGIFNFNKESFSFKPNLFFNKWLGTKHVSAIASNGTNKIYYIQDHKVGLLKQETFGTYQNEEGLFKHINKYLNDDLANISLLDEHNVLFGAKEGFIRYDPNKEFKINEDFRVIIRSVEIQSSKDSSSILYPQYIQNKKIPINQSVKFQYASPFFDGFNDLKYSYRLMPLDDKWSAWSSLGEKEYPYLPSGDYWFEVKAINVYGIESEVSSFPFVVLTPWYFSSWAILLYVIIGIIIMAFVPLIQRKKFNEEKGIINFTKDEALKEKNDEIDRLNNEKLMTEIDLKNDQLTTITMHSMNNNEFIRSVRNKIELHLEQGGSKIELRRIMKSIDVNLSNKDSWDQFAYHFDQVHGDYLKKLSNNNVKLSPREIKLAAFLRMNMSSKEISTLMNITVRGVELARHRLRKKLKLERDQNLVEYLIELDND